MGTYIFCHLFVAKIKKSWYNVSRDKGVIAMTEYMLFSHFIFVINVITFFLNPFILISIASGIVTGILTLKPWNLKKLSCLLGISFAVSLFGVLTLLMNNSPDYLLLPLLAIPFTVIIFLFWLVKFIVLMVKNNSLKK